MSTYPAPRVSGGIGTYARAARQHCADDHGTSFDAVAILTGRTGTVHIHDAECPERCWRACDNAAFVWDLSYVDPRTGRTWEATYALTLDCEQVICWMD